MKRPDSFLREYARSLPDENLYFLHMRFQQNLCGDLSEIATIMQSNYNIDKWLNSADTVEEWFGMLDLVSNQIKQEVERKAAEKEQKRNRRNKEYIRV
jgi:hypothetical protein